MTSIGFSKQVIETGFMPTFKVQDQVYHRIGSIFPCPAEEPNFLQIYFIDSNTEQAEQRCKIVQQVKQDLVLKLQDMLQLPAGEHSRRFNEPTASVVAVIMARDQHGKRDIVLETRNSSIQKIADTHKSYDALQYPLMFWQGEDGYYFQLHQRNLSTEWQKRGLPHAHILVWFQETLHVHKVDDFISAEIPNPEEDPELFSCITTQMIHETQTGKDGYPLYHCRKPEDGGFSTVIKVQHSEVVVDNRWIVPYCPLLSRIFCAHINVEYCNSIKLIKYVCKYINKGSDMAVFDVTSCDGNACNEVHQYEMGKYISSNEAVRRILYFSIHERYPTVIHLSVHRENGQRVYFTEGNATERARFAPETTLTAFYHLCNEDEFARTLFYHQVPRYYTWDSKNKKWSRRKIGQSLSDHPGIKSTDAIDRVYAIHPNNSECFHLW
ncbi:helitron_like_N domain-containing protein [Trichonephila clavipes]|nr:helitron_like_N domain-containing protein [Trichonephila clavipes]